MTLISLAWPRERFVDRVVDDFVREVVRARGVGVHARAAAHGLETGEDFDVGCGVGHSLPLMKNGSARPVRAARREVYQRIPGRESRESCGSGEFRAQPAARAA